MHQDTKTSCAGRDKKNLVTVTFLAWSCDSIPIRDSGHGQHLPFWVHKRPHSKWYHILQPSTTTFTLHIVEINGSEWKSNDVLGSRIFIFTLDGAETEQK
jgi:hypothetical protein